MFEPLYSDRLTQWDYKKARLLQEKHFGKITDTYSNIEESKIEDFLKEYLNKDLKLIIMLKGCNVSNGYPIWTFLCKDLSVMR